MKENFKILLDEYYEDLKLYVPTVAKVHGSTHPSFFKVKDIYDRLIEKVEKADDNGLDLSKEFEELRLVTDNYDVPKYTCGTYEAVYQMLKSLDEAYS